MIMAVADMLNDAWFHEVALADRDAYILGFADQKIWLEITSPISTAHEARY